MKRYGVAVTALISLVFFVSMAGPRASAQSPSRFDSFLQSGGFTVVSSSPVRYAGISQMGEALTVSRAGETTQVSFFEYSDGAKLRQDWDVEAGKPVAPLANGFVGDLTGHVAMSNASNEVIVLDPRSPAENGVMRGVGQAFLSLPPPTAGDSAFPASATANAPVSPPHTGDASLAIHHRELPVWAGLLWTGVTASAIVLAAAGALFVLMKVRRLA